MLTAYKLKTYYTNISFLRLPILYNFLSNRLLVFMKFNNSFILKAINIVEKCKVQTSLFSVFTDRMYISLRNLLKVLLKETISLFSIFKHSLKYLVH